METVKTNIQNVDNTFRKGPKVLGVELTPLWTQLEKRKQMATILVSFIILAFAPFMFFVLLLVNPVAAFLYLGWIYYDRETPEAGGRRIEWIRNLNIWKHCKNYFPIKLIKTMELDPKKNYLFCAHPHGIICFGTVANVCTPEDFNKIFSKMTPHILTLNILFKIPFTRDIILTFGACPATKKSMNYLLSYPGGGKVVVLLPGGVTEMLESHTNTDDLLILKNRKGFIKVALQNGSPLVPVYSFGETNIYEQLNNPEGSIIRRIQLIFIKIIGFYVPLINGRGILQYSFGFLPKRIPITTVVGAPIEVVKTNEPTHEEIDTLHENYMNALKKLFYKYREECGYPNAELNII